MKNTLKTIIATLIFSTYIFASAQAFWTGKSRQGTSVTGQAIISCEYKYGNRVFWQSFSPGACPVSIEVQ